MNDSIGKMISILQRKAQSYYTKFLKDYGISSAEYPVLFYLNGRDGVTQDEIVTELSIDKGAVTRILQSLSDKQMIERKKDDFDHRCNRIFLTELGKETHKPVHQAKENWNTILTKHMSDKEEKELTRLLSLAIQNLKESL